jgi:dipeptidyl aminopeptidase/acylaminoacyl peptidase
MKKILFVFLAGLGMHAIAQEKTTPDTLKPVKKIVDYTTYDGWKSVVSPTISNDGTWVTWEVNPQVGDGKLFLYNTNTQAVDSFNRAKSASFVYAGSGYLAFKISAPYKVIRKAKLDKKKPDDMPKDTLAVLDLATKKLTKLGNVKSFSVNDYSTVIMAQLGKEKKVSPVLSKREQKKRKKHPPVELKSEGTTLVAWNPATGEQKRILNVMEFTTAAKSAATAYVVQQKGKNDSSYVYTIELADSKFKTTKVHENNGWSKSLQFDEKGKQLAFLTTTDTAKTNKLFTLYLKKETDITAKLLVDTSTAKIQKGLAVSENGKLYFSQSGNKLFFGISTIPKKEPKDTLLEEEKYVLDIWHWDDDRIQPEQLKSVDKDKKNTYLTCYNFANNELFQVESDTLKLVQSVQKGDLDIALAASDKRYRKSQTWETQLPTDYYLVDLKTGKNELILEKKSHTVQLSYTGKYLTWYEPVKRDWYNMNLQNHQSVVITNRIDDNLFEDNNGLAEQPNPFGIMGWSKNDDFIYIYSEFEIWKINPDNKEQVSCITKNRGGEFNTDLRYVKTDPDMDYIDDNWLLLKSFNHHNKREGFWAYTNGNLKPLMMEDARIVFLGKAKNSDKILYAKMDFETFPDLLLNDVSFGGEKRLSFANPQQKDYNWGTAELVKWETPEGRELEGILYKPEDFDANKKYPMIVYYYEKNADNLHQYRSPRPSASTVNYTEYVSNGYVIFVPDIVYKLGDPGKSAVDCIVSGTKAMIAKGFIDEKNIAIQGQSWGGYQTAFLVTQTNMFKCAFAGAPVGNMTSAYGGVRWESGLLRAFQYEKGQSRIGKTLWEDREAYIRNSPVFFLDKVNTPLLLMNNDADGAVPWYQGIEIYTGLRRMEKACWLLNYNGDGHNLTKRPNQVDLSRRMLGFFNHYLKGAPMPEWMKEGVDAVEKGKVTGYELEESGK